MLLIVEGLTQGIVEIGVLRRIKLVAPLSTGAAWASGRGSLSGSEKLVSPEVAPAMSRAMSPAFASGADGRVLLSHGDRMAGRGLVLSTVALPHRSRGRG